MVRLVAAAALALLLATGWQAAWASGSDCSAAAAPPEAVASGPTPYPQDMSAMPGRGFFKPMGWMAQNRQSFWKHRAEDRCAVVFVGDSMIAGWTQLKADFAPLKVVNRGIGGDVSRGVLFRLDEDVLDLAPRAIVILVGTNDLSATQEPEVTASNIDLMLRRIDERAPGTPVILCQLPPRDNPNARIDPSRLLSLNRMIAALGAGRGNVSIADLYTPFATADGVPDAAWFKPDHLHLNDSGHSKARDRIMPLLAHVDTNS